MIFCISLSYLYLFKIILQIDEAKQTADGLFKEVLNRKDRADATRNALSVLTRFRFIFFLPESIDENMNKVSVLK